jgi:drug/metabolite transporter (DMT)-like permease
VVIPVFAMILSTIFEGYVWSTLAMAGGALVVVGLVVAMQTRKA